MFTYHVENDTCDQWHIKGEALEAVALTQSLRRGPVKLGMGDWGHWQMRVGGGVFYLRALDPEELQCETKLRWFGYVRQREEGHILRRALNFEVEGRRPPGRPKKTWRKVVEEDMRMLNITEEMARDRQQWRRLMFRQTLLWEYMDIKQ